MARRWQKAHSSAMDCASTGIHGSRAAGWRLWQLFAAAIVLSLGAAVAGAMRAHIMAQAARRSYARLSLETGPMAGFESAHRLYASFGFTPCGPFAFAGYVEDPHSVLMTRTL